MARMLHYVGAYGIADQCVLKKDTQYEEARSCAESKRKQLIFYAFCCNAVKWPLEVIQGHLFQGIVSKGLNIITISLKCPYE